MTQSFNTNVTFILTWYSLILLFSTTTRSLRLAGFTMGEMSNPTGEKRVVGLRVSVSTPFHSPSPFTLNRSYCSRIACAWS